MLLAVAQYVQAGAESALIWSLQTCEESIYWDAIACVLHSSCFKLQASDLCTSSFSV